MVKTFFKKGAREGKIYLQGEALLFLSRLSADMFLGSMTDFVYDETVRYITGGKQYMNVGNGVLPTPAAADDDDDDDDRLQKQMNKKKEAREGLDKMNLRLIKKGIRGDALVDSIKEAQTWIKAGGDIDSIGLDALQYSLTKIQAYSTKVYESGSLGTAFQWSGIAMVTILTGEGLNLIGNPGQDMSFKGWMGYCKFFSEPLVGYVKNFILNVASENSARIIAEFQIEIDAIFRKAYEEYVKRPIMESDFFKKIKELKDSGKAWLANSITKHIYFGAFIQGVLNNVIERSYNTLILNLDIPQNKILQLENIYFPKWKQADVRVVLDAINGENIISIYTSLARKIKDSGREVFWFINFPETVDDLLADLFDYDMGITVVGRNAITFGEASTGKTETPDLKSNLKAASDYLKYQTDYRAYQVAWAYWNMTGWGTEPVEPVRPPLPQNILAYMADQAIYSATQPIHGTRKIFDKFKVKAPGGGEIVIEGRDGELLAEKYYDHGIIAAAAERLFLENNFDGSGKLMCSSEFLQKYIKRLKTPMTEQEICNKLNDYYTNNILPATGSPPFTVPKDRAGRSALLDKLAGARKRFY
jgi:hypothetical protein